MSIPLPRTLNGVMLVLCGVLSLALRAEVSVTIVVPTTTMSLDEPLEFSVQVSGDRAAEQPVFPPSQDYDLEFAGTSSQVQIINGEITSSTEFAYTLLAKHEGTLTLGPAEVQSQGQTYRSNIVTLKVEKTTATRPAEKHFFATATVDTTNPYIYSQMIYTFKFYNRAHIAGATFKAPDFKGFTREDLGKQREYQETYAGQSWHVTEINIALFPTSPGEITIDPSTLALNVFVQEAQRRRRGGMSGFFDDGFFGSQRQKSITLRTDPIKLTVNPLPPPPGGSAKTLLVGNYFISSAASASEGKVGDSITLTVVVEGEGNIWDAQLEQPTSPDFKVYADKPLVKTEARNKKLFGRKEFKFALVPLTPGTKQLPQFVLRYFDPHRSTYQQLTTSAEQLVVSPADAQDLNPHKVGNAPLAASQKEVTVVGSDLMPIKTDTAALKSDVLTANEAQWIMLCFVLCPSLYGVFYLQARRKAGLGDSSLIRRRKKAFARFTRACAELSAQKDFYASALHLVRSYLADRFDIPGQSLTSADVARILGDKGIAATTLRELEAVLQRCEQGQYGGGGATGSNDELRRSIFAVVERIETQR